jgi:predicted dehydrogenase
VLTTARDPVSVLMVAIGGYGQHYLNALVDLAPACRLAGVVDPIANQSPVWPTVAAQRVPVHATIEEFYDAGHSADLAVIASPIHFHVPQSIVALEHGTCVLCDKPLGASVEEADALCRVRDQSRRWAMIGYQWSFSAGIQALKRDILEGRFGVPRRVSALCCWPRDITYYRRNDWAGRLRDVTTGRPVLDSPANNAMAHYLHNLFFLLGPEMHLSAQPRCVEAEMYRAYAIESADTAMCRAMAGQDVEVLFYASHVTSSTIAPRFRLEFDDAVVTFGEETAGITAISRGGHRHQYPAPDETPQFHKLRVAVDGCAAGQADAAIVCGPEAARPQTVCVNAMHESAGEIREFGPGFVHSEGTPERLWVDGLDEVLLRCWAQRCMPSDTGVAWAVRGGVLR